jgi:hypothetical protein
MSEIRVDKIISHAGNSAPDLPQGATISGVTTVSSVKVGSGITIDSSGINVTGVGTFSGDATAAGFAGTSSPTIKINDGATEKGYIGYNGNDPFIGRKNGVGVAFQNNKIRPADGDDGSASNNTVDIGEPTYKFKDLHLAGDASIAGSISGVSSVTATSFYGNGANLTSTPLGFGMIDSWYLRMGAANETNVNLQTYNNVVLGDWNTSTGNLRWERFGLNANGQVNVGSAMTVSSSGVFSFPTTGIYQATLKLNWQDYSTTNIRYYAQIQGTTDNGTNWHNLVSDAGSKMTGDTSAPVRPFLPAFNVTNTSTHKLKVLFQGGGAGYSTYGGGVGVGASYYSQWKFITITKIN